MNLISDRFIRFHQDLQRACICPTKSVRILWCPWGTRIIKSWKEQVNITYMQRQGLHGLRAAGQRSKLCRKGKRLQRAHAISCGIAGLSHEIILAVVWVLVNKFREALQNHKIAGSSLVVGVEANQETFYGNRRRIIDKFLVRYDLFELEFGH